MFMLDKGALEAQASKFEQAMQQPAAEPVAEAPAEPAPVEPKPQAEEERVPYARFESVIQERNSAKERISALEAEMEALKKPEPSIFDDPPSEVEQLKKELAGLKESMITRDTLEQDKAEARLRRELDEATQKFPSVEKELLWAAASRKENLGKPLPELAASIYEQRVKWAEEGSWRTEVNAPPRAGRTHTSPVKPVNEVRDLKTARDSAERRLKKLFGM